MNTQEIQFGSMNNLRQLARQLQMMTIELN